MKNKLYPVTALVIFVLFTAGASTTDTTAGSETNNAIVIRVPGTANPWLAGMPDGSTAGNQYDVAPDQSPVQIRTVPITAGTILSFSVTGAVANGPFPLVGADGIDTCIVSRIPGAENGISDTTAPINSLMGIFLDDSLPAKFVPPATLDFSAPASRDFVSLYPQLRQPFFIGDGKDATGGVQQFIVPPGATRLFLGTMDSYQWANNQGSFTVTITIVPASP